jgi:hypothetical protein
MENTQIVDLADVDLDIDIPCFVPDCSVAGAILIRHKCLGCYRNGSHEVICEHHYSYFMSKAMAYCARCKYQDRPDKFIKFIRYL